MRNGLPDGAGRRDPPTALSPKEAAAVAGAPVRAAYRFAAERLPPGGTLRSGGQRLLTRWGAVCLALDRSLPRDVPLAVRRRLYAAILRRPAGDDASASVAAGPLSYVLDVRQAARRVDAGLARYRAAMALIVEDGDIQGGAATFRGTRILVHGIAALLAAGATEAELREDHPRLTAAMIAAAPIYARVHPRRGRPRSPAWRGAARSRPGG